MEAGVQWLDSFPCSLPVSDSHSGGGSRPAPSSAGRPRGVVQLSKVEVNEP